MVDRGGGEGRTGCYTHPYGGTVVVVRGGEVGVWTGQRVLCGGRRVAAAAPDRPPRPHPAVLSLVAPIACGVVGRSPPLCARLSHRGRCVSGVGGRQGRERGVGATASTPRGRRPRLRGGGSGAARRTRATRRRQRGRLTPRFLLVASAGRGEFVGVARLISLSILLVAAGAAAAARRRGREDGRARAPPPGGGRRVADERRGGRVCFPPAPLSVLIFPRPPSPSCLDGRGGGCAATRTRAHPRGGLYRASPSPCHFAPG